MTRMKPLGILLAGVVLGAAGTHALQAQEAVERVELRRADLTGADGTEIVMATVTIPPGGAVARHFHHGDEVLYVLEGGSFQAPGTEPVTVEAGATLHFPREVAHGGFTVVGERTLKVVTVHIVDKAKPLAEPVQ